MGSKSAGAVTLLLFALGVAVATPHDASAYACAGPQIWVLAADEAIPTDSIIRLRFPGAEAHVRRLGQNRTILEEGDVTAERAVFVLRGPDDVAVPMRRRIVEGTYLPTLELVPSHLLAEHTTYRIFARLDGRDFDIGMFETSTVSPPVEFSAPTHVRARYVVLSHVEYKGTSGPWVEVRWDALEHPAPLYEVHAVGEDGAIKSGTLRAVVEGGAKGITFGKTELCSPADFAATEAGSLKLVLRALDRAGRKGPTIPLTLDTAHPSPRGFGG